MSDLDTWFTAIYEANYSRLTKVAYFVLWDKDMVEDIVQSAFAALLLKREKLRDHPNIAGWLTLAVRQLIENEQSRARYTREVSLRPEHEPVADEPPEDFMSLLPLGLSEEERQILYLHIEVGLPHKEIAVHLGCTPEASRMRLSRAKRRYKELTLKK